MIGVGCLKRLCFVPMLLAAATGYGRQLSTARWTFTEVDSGRRLGQEMVDVRLETAWTSSEMPSASHGVVVDLGQETFVHRVLLCSGNKGRLPPRMKIVLVGKPMEPGAPVKFDLPVPDGAREVNLILDPVIARQMRVETTAAGSAPWSIAELEIYGNNSPGAFQPADAVVVDAGAPAALGMAAEELRYYLGELTGRAVPVVSPERAGVYPGTIYRIMDLKPLATTWEALEANRQSGKIPATDVNVERQGREVLFRAWPYANVRASVWKFLERQGVRWLYPDNHGDYVPAGKGVNLECLPLRCTPSAGRRYANFDTERFCTRPEDAGFLFWWRNGYNSTWGGHQRRALGGEEVPPNPHGLLPRKQWKEEHREGFDGYPHNFASVVPDRIVAQHPDWWGMVKDQRWAAIVGIENLGKRISPARHGPAVCLTNRDMIRYVAEKAVAITAGAESTATLNLLPMDAASFCECEACRKLYEPLERPKLPYCAHPTFMASDAYYHFVAEVAKALRAERPKVRILALAYANVHSPPRKIGRLPDNVTVEVCQYGEPNLPIDSRSNSTMKACLEQWQRQCARMEHYDYTLLNESRESFVMPVPLVTALGDRARFLHKLGALDGGTQADAGSIPYSPWNHYAYPRLLWDAGQSTSELLQEFFSGYFGEAAQPMLAYYRTLEDHLIRNDVSLHPHRFPYGSYTYDVTPGSFPYVVLVALRRHLEKAEGLVRGWVVAQRVARIREGFQWVLKENGLTADDLTDSSVFPGIGPGPEPAVIEPAAMRWRKFFVQPWKNGEWAFLAHGALSGHLRWEKPGDYVVTLTARGVPCENIDPIVHVYVDHHCGGSLAINAGEFKDYEFRVPSIPAGVGRLLIGYWNAASGGRRNVYVRQISIRRVSSPGTTGD